MKSSARHLEVLAWVVVVASSAAFGVEHPVPITTDSNCAECHESKTKAQHTHSAIASGCTSCHEVKVSGETVVVDLIQPTQTLCFTCHEKQGGQSVHWPYNAGECTACHDPHGSAFQGQLKAEMNQLCLACHLDGAASATENSTARIYLDKDRVYGHPYFGHPVAGHPDPLNPKAEMTCLSCHLPHAGAELKLIAPPRRENADVLNNESESSQDICLQCHTKINKDTQETGHRHSYQVTGPASRREPEETYRRPRH